jgi:hypothetical protein
MSNRIKKDVFYLDEKTHLESSPSKTRAAIPPVAKAPRLWHTLINNLM